MNEEELAPHYEELKKVLEGKVGDDELLEELKNYVFKYRTDVASAKKAIIRKYGGPSIGFVTAENVVKKIDELTGDEQNVDVVAKVVFVQNKRITSRGTEKDITSGIAGDETGTVSFTEWSGTKEIAKGRTYRFKNCYCKKWNDTVQLNIGNKSVIEDAGTDITVKEREFTPAQTVTKKIAEMDGTERSVDFLGKIIFSEAKEITTRDRGIRPIISGIVGDETATASFTLWNDSPALEKGKVYWFRNCYTRKWNDDVQIQIGNNGSVEESDEVIENIPKRQTVSEPKEMGIGEIRENSGNVTVTGRIISCETRQIETRNGPKTVYSGNIADDTGEIQYSAWNDFSLAAGKSYRIANAYIRSWKGIPQINLGDNTQVSEADVVFDDSKLCQGNERTVGDIARNGGGTDVIVRGVVVDIRPGSGMIRRCPQCNRAVIGNECKTHGTVEGIPDLRMRIMVDDGTGSISTTMNREATERITGVTFDMAVNLAKARGEDMVLKELGDRLYIKQLKVRGNAMIDEYGLKMNAKEITADDVDVEEGVRSLLKEVEGML